MKSIIRPLLIVIATILCALSTRAQEPQEPNECDSIVSLLSRVMRFNQWRPQEKVYLHLDNNAYFKGETIWFTGYVVRADVGTPTDLSRILYVELLNPTGDVVERRKLPINDGVAYGDIKVDSIVLTGFYEIRAFTRYMTNWGADACFSRVVPIFKEPKLEGDYSNPVIDKLNYHSRLNNERAMPPSPLKGEGNANIVAMEGEDVSKLKTQNSKQKNSKLRAHFYPEGGNIVEGLPANIAFTLVDADGMPVSAQCSVVDEKTNAVVTECSTDSRGFGLFSLQEARSGLVLKASSGNFKLPLPLGEGQGGGVALHLDMLDDEKATLTLRCSQSMHDRLLGLLVTHNGKIFYGDTIRATSQYVKEFPRQSLPKGVSQITIFNTEGQILAERMFFVCPDAAASNKIGVTSPTNKLKPCGKVRFDITALPNSSLSFSAIDADGLINGSSGNINTWMLLSSEVRGYIAHLEYYFESDDLEHRQAADLLMLIQGWRRYDWSLMTGQSTFVKYQPIEDKQYLFGRLRQKSKKATVDNVWLDTKLYNAQGQVIEGTTKTDSIGNYIYELPDIEGEWRLLINTGKAGKDGYWKDLNYYTAIDRNFSPQGRYISPLETTATPIDTTNIFRWTFTEAEERWISQLNRSRVLKNVTVTAQKRFWDRTNWGNESNPQKHSVQYYNCDEHADRIADEGDDMPSFGKWLCSVNSFFDGEDLPNDGYTATEDTTIVGTACTIYKLELGNSSPGATYYRDGLGYNNRPIVWIIDNQFHSVTNLPPISRIEVYYQDPPSLNPFPVMLDEVKSVYISEDLNLLHNHYRCSQIDSRRPVAVFLYTHRSYLYKTTGLRRTYYQGYNIPSTFQMEDYTDIPPIEDFRRTLYWLPTVATDANGHATIEFWNNSTAKQIKISCEGMTQQGELQAY